MLQKKNLFVSGTTFVQAGYAPRLGTSQWNARKGSSSRGQGKKFRASQEVKRQ